MPRRTLRVHPFLPSISPVLWVQRRVTKATWRSERKNVITAPLLARSQSAGPRYICYKPLAKRIPHDESCHLRFGLSAADERRGRASWLGQLRRQQTRHDHWSDLVLQVREPARHDHRAGQRQGLDGDARAHLAHEQRGATEKVVAVGQDVSAYGYPSTVEKDEMRAERITVNGKTYEMR